jgi:hypothetical protein
MINLSEMNINRIHKEIQDKSIQNQIEMEGTPCNKKEKLDKDKQHLKIQENNRHVQR